MTIFIICAIAFCALSIFLCIWGDDGYSGARFAAQLVGMFGCVISLIAVGVIGFLSLQWVGSAQKANIINREYGTKYTQAEVFYASSVIDTVRELDRRRYEVNGDVLRDSDPNVQSRREQTK